MGTTYFHGNVFCVNAEYVGSLSKSTIPNFSSKIKDINIETKDYEDVTFLTATSQSVFLFVEARNNGDSHDGTIYVNGIRIGSDGAAHSNSSTGTGSMYGFGGWISLFINKTDIVRFQHWCHGVRGAAFNTMSV